MTATLVDHDAALRAFADEVGRYDPVAVRGSGTRWSLGGELAPGTRLIGAPAGIVSYAPEEMVVRVRTGTTVAELHAELFARGQRTPLIDRGGTVGGALAVGENDIFVLGRGKLRSSLLQVRYVSAEGRIVNGGGPTVKNVTGFDLPRLMVGSLGTLGLLAEVILRTNPVPPADVWLASTSVDPFVVRDAVLRPSAVLWDGTTTWLHLEGHAADIGAERSTLRRLATFEEVSGPPPLPPRRWSLSPADLRTMVQRGIGSFVAVIGVGLAFGDHPQPSRRPVGPVADIHRRMKANFDPTGRLNPGREPGA
jgi:glycolate oxidase FAD binding subunit